MQQNRVLILILVIATAVLVSGCGITARRSSQGYADLGSLRNTDTDKTLSLSLGPSVLRFAAGFMEDDPATQQLLRNLDGVRVKTYAVGESVEQVSLRIDEISQRLQNQGWEPVVVVQEFNERTHILVKLDGDNIAGLTVMNVDGEELVLINVMGNLPPESFSQTMAALDVTAPEVRVAGRP